MANIVIVGGGFGGMVAAESLVKRVSSDHQITLIARNRKFVFYPGLVRFAFGESENVEFDIREALLDRRIRFVEGEVARINFAERQIKFARGDFFGKMPYDYLVVALGRRLKTELVGGFYEYGRHLLGLRAAQDFGSAAKAFNGGRIIIGACSGARLPVPLFETAFLLSKQLEERQQRDSSTITIVSDESLDMMFGGAPLSHALTRQLEANSIELVTDFQIDRITAQSVVARDGRELDYDLNMIIPPFAGPAALVGTEVVDGNGFVRVNPTMRICGLNGAYAAGDCVAFEGPKMGHMAVKQAEVVAENLAAEVQGRPLPALYEHEMMLVVDGGENEATFVQKNLWTDENADVYHGRFWGWAKRKQQEYWLARHA